MGRKKKQKLVYEDPEDAQKAAELEAFLFGGPGGVLKEVKLLSDDDDDDALDLEALLKSGQDSLLFVEDHGEGGGGGDSQGDDEEGEEEGEEEEEKGQAGSSDEGEEAGPGPGSARQQQAGRSGGGGRAVWHDPADADISVSLAAQARLRKLRQFKGQDKLQGEAYAAALRKQHALLNPHTAWADLPGSKRRRRPQGDGQGAAGLAAGEVDEVPPDMPEDGDDDESAAEALLRDASGLLAARGRGSKLAPGVIEMSRLRDANQHAPSAAVVQAVRWHPNAQLLMTAGFDKKLRLFAVDGLRNPVMQTVHLSDLPIHAAEWAAGGTCAVAAGRRPFYCVYDVAGGRVDRCAAPVTPHAAAPKSLESFAACADEANPLLAFLLDGGHVALTSLRSRQAVGSLKMSGSVRCAVFDDAGTHLLTSGSDGMIYTWDLRMRRPLHRQVDEGAVGATSLALSPGGTYLASGSSSGVVNVYARPQGLLDPLLALASPLGAGGGGGGGGGPRKPDASRPVKALLNLTTAVDSLAFSPDGQMLSMASRLKREALRLVHLPSLTVFSNWPTARTPLHYVHSLGFSPGGGFLSVGNAKGRALLYRLHHYPRA